MKILLLSDVHDNVWALQAILQSNEAKDTDVLIFCGDLCAPFLIDLLSAYKKPLHIVLGNNDCDVSHMTEKLPKYPNVQIHGEYYRDDLDGVTIAVNHYPDKAQTLVDLQAYNIVCYGHDHQIHASIAGKTLKVNPGAVMGFSGRTLKDIDSSFMILDTIARSVNAYKISNYREDAAKATFTLWDEYSLRKPFA